MKELRITLGKRPGELARVAENLSRQSVNIKAVSVTAGANQVTLDLILDV